jgi:hypothetical protein
MRPLLDHEIPLTQHLLSIGCRHERAEQLLVEPLSGGGMGGLRIGGSSIEWELGRKVAETQFSDADGTPVIASLNVDVYDQLFEIDVWKVDFSALQRWPSQNEVSQMLFNPSLLRTTSPSNEL